MTTETMTSREWILDKIRKGKPELEPLPEMPHYAFPGDQVTQFMDHLSGFDGKMLTFASRDEVIEWLNKSFDRQQKKIFSAVPDFEGTIHKSDFKTPHDAHVVDICVSEGVLGVAETGSVWVNNDRLGLAASALFSTDLYLLLDKENLVSSLHDAYRQFDLRANQYGSFYTGPSATADIEAVHITGAQAELSLTVLLYESL